MMVFDATAGARGMAEERKAMAMLWSGGGPALDLSMALQRNGWEGGGMASLPGRRCPIQLDLLPMPASSFTRHPHPSSRLDSKAMADAEAVEVVSFSRGGSPRGIDMNQLPSSDYDDGDVSSPNSILSPFHTAGGGVKASGVVSPKRERESFGEFDQEVDRGGEATSRGSDDDDAGMPRKKLRLSKEQSALLEESFKEHSTLNPKQKSALAKQLSLRPRQVEVWFQNRRARTKLKQTEVDCELLKRCCETLTDENRRLQKELQELRAIKLPHPSCIIAPDFFMPFPAATLTMCPSCERVTPAGHTARPPHIQPHAQAQGPLFAKAAIPH